MKHVLWIHRHAAARGGAERYIIDTAQRLRERGVRSTLLYDVDGDFRPSFAKAFDQAFPCVEPASQARSIGADVAYGHDVPSEVLVALSAALPTFRFLHDHALFCLRRHKYTLRGQTCHRVSGPGCYVRCSGLVREPRAPFVRLASLTALRREQRSLRSSCELVVGSRYLKRHAQAHGFSPDQVHALTLPYAGPARMYAPRDSRHFLYVGGLLRSKGLDVLLRAIREVPQATLEIAGEGSQRAWVEDGIRRLGLASRVRLRGRLEGEALTRAYAGAAALVLPSRTPETFGLTGLEAHGQGTPVIASAEGGVGEWLVPQRTGIAVPSNDVHALRRAMSEAIAHPEKLRAMGEEGFRALCRFRPEEHDDALLALFRSRHDQRRAA